jgi:aromatic ring hydroxylase
MRLVSKGETPERVAENLQTVAASIPKIMPPAADMKEPTVQNMLAFFQMIWRIKS